MKDQDQKRTLFVGGPRHGHTVSGQPSKEGELYRVPAVSKKDKPVDYRATEVTLTFPDPITKQPGDTYSCFVYVTPDAYPDSPEHTQNLQMGLPEAAMRLYLITYGINVTGGPEAVAAQRVPIYVAWCDECKNAPSDVYPWKGDDGETGTDTEFPTLRDRANSMMSHTSTAGHQAQWENRER